MAKKAKTYKAAKKRFKLSAKGKVKHKTQGNNAHLKVNKSRAQKARRKNTRVMESGRQANIIRKLIS